MTAPQSPDLRQALAAAGLRSGVICELQERGVRAASDLLDWGASDLLRIHGVGRRTVDVIAAFVRAI